MGSSLNLTANDGQTLAAYLARPQGTPRGALVLAQEIFGVNSHIRGVADGFAEEDYLTIAPALFDRIRPGIELGYGPAEIDEGRALKEEASIEAALLDLAAALTEVAPAGKAAIVGYCWGGTLAWAAACKLPGLSAAVSYYGGGTPEMEPWIWSPVWPPDPDRARAGHGLESVTHGCHRAGRTFA